ncbi:hypothetical protein EMGBS5_06970 [Clavibacter sp.]|nr:hypothetical protein EMGBS5_06970 [Clavibacter sp.]
MNSKLVTILITCLVAALLSPATGQADQVKVVAKKTAKPIPSPAAKWPPEGFKGKEGVYAKVPSSKDVIGLLSAKKSLQPLVKTCEEFACGAVFVASETGCKWWEVNSSVFSLKASDLSKEKIGTLATYHTSSKAKEQATIFLISGAEVTPGTSIGAIKVICHRDSTNKPKPGNIYSPIVAPTPTASPSNS